MRRLAAPLDWVLSKVNPTPEERLQQHLRKLEIALEQRDVDEAIREFNLMRRLLNDIRKP